VRLRVALGALLFPNARGRFLDLRFCSFRGSKPNDPRLIGLLHGALRMDAAQRIRCFTTDGTEIPDRLRDNDDWFDDAHVAPNGEVLSEPGRTRRDYLSLAEIQAFAGAILPHLRRNLKFVHHCFEFDCGEHDISGTICVRDA
jgi:hypothetical protein